MNLRRALRTIISRCENAPPFAWAQRLLTGGRMNVTRWGDVAGALVVLLVGCGPMHGETVTPHKPGTPGELKREKAVEMAELDDMLCVRLDDGHVRCALLDSHDDYGAPQGFGLFNDVPLLGTTGLAGFDRAPDGDPADGGVTVARAVCAQSEAGRSCAFFDDHGTTQESATRGRIRPTPLSSAKTAQQVGLALCATWPTGPDTCAWAVESLRKLPRNTQPRACQVAADQTITCVPAPALPGPGDAGTEDTGFIVVALDPVESQPLAGADNAVQLSTSRDSMSSCAVTVDGHVQCWGKLGASDGGVVDVKNEAGETLSGAVQVAAASDHACAILSDGSVVCWGRSGLFAPSSSSAAAVQVPEVQHALTVVASDLPATADGDCALQSDGLVICWGGADVHHGWADGPGTIYPGPGT